MVLHHRTPEISIREENLRRKTLNELNRIGKVHGEEVLSQILLHAVDPNFVHSAQKWVSQGDGSALKYLRRMGIFIRQKGRMFSVTDKKGSFTFVDDYYYSGINFLIKKYSDFFQIPFGVMDIARVPNSLKPLMGAYWDESKEHCGALDFLVDLHVNGNYDNTKFVLKMLGGNFKSLRALALPSGRFEIVGPVFERAAVRNASGKLLSICVEGSSVESWVDTIMMVMKSDVDNIMCELLVKKGDERLAHKVRDKAFQFVKTKLGEQKVFDHVLIYKLHAFLVTYGMDHVQMTSFIMRYRQQYRSLYLHNNGVDIT